RAEGMPKRARADATAHALGRPAGTPGPKGLARTTGHRVGLSALRPSGAPGLTSAAAAGSARRGHKRSGSKRRTRESHHGPRSGPDFRAEWPREESNLRARIRSPSLYPLSYGAVRRSVAASQARSSRAQPP